MALQRLLFEEACLWRCDRLLQLERVEIPEPEKPGFVNYHLKDEFFDTEAIVTMLLP